MIKIWIYGSSLPSATSIEEVEAMKKVIGMTTVDAYSLDDKDKIVQGTGCIKINDDYNYHNNTDESKEAMFFNNKEKFFTLSYERIKELYNAHAIQIRAKINEKLNEYPEL